MNEVNYCAQKSVIYLSHYAGKRGGFFCAYKNPIY